MTLFCLGRLSDALRRLGIVEAYDHLATQTAMPLLSCTIGVFAFYVKQD